MSSSEQGALIAGRYRLASELGRGAMGVVWLARDERLGRTVAVKELRAGYGLSATQVEQSHLRARREARIAARLHHPNAVAVYDVAEHDGQPYLVMEYVAARSLSELLADEVLEPEQAAEIGVQLASALAAAHEAGIVHRDVKPGNILLTEEGRAKLTDFGISRAVGDVTVTGTGEMLGTPAYVAPEVAQGRPAGAASDVFSLGATLYAAVEGVAPFGTGPTVMALLLRIVNGELRPPQRCGRLADTLLWMMRTDPADRPTMESARRALQEAAAREAEDAAAAESGQRPRNPASPVSAPDSPGAAEPASAAAARTRAGADTDTDIRGELDPLAMAAESLPPTPPAAASDSRRRMLPWALLAVAAVLTTGIVAGIVASGSHGETHSVGSATAPAKPTASSHPATTSAGGGTSAAPSTAAATSSADVDAQLTSTIAGYYRLVPDHLDQGWVYLTPDYQRNHAGGMSGYTQFWSQIQSVSASDIVAQSPATVVATLTYHYRDGRIVQERTSFGMVESGGVWKIASTSVLSSKTL